MLGFCDSVKFLLCVVWWFFFIFREGNLSSSLPPFHFCGASEKGFDQLVSVSCLVCEKQDVHLFSISLSSSQRELVELSKSSFPKSHKIEPVLGISRPLLWNGLIFKPQAASCIPEQSLPVLQRNRVHTSFCHEVYTSSLLTGDLVHYELAWMLHSFWAAVLTFSLQMIIPT